MADTTRKTTLQPTNIDKEIANDAHLSLSWFVFSRPGLLTADERVTIIEARRILARIADAQ